MSDDLVRQQAMVLFERARRHHMKGELGDAMVLYKRSLAVCPTAEAHTFLGWCYGMLDRHEEAIAACENAIAVDPEFGNPYNDIGAYLIELDRWEEALPWLEKATRAPRYEAPHYPYLNMGRVHQHLGRYRTALDCFEQALALDPLYVNAIYAKYQLLGKLN